MNPFLAAYSAWLRASLDLHLALVAPFLPRSPLPIAERDGNVIKVDFRARAHR